MQLQTIEHDGKTYALVQDGKPVYKADDGKDVAFDAASTVNTINRLTEESKGFKARAQTAETTLKAFEGLDATAARDALDKLSKIDAKKLVEAGDMDAAIQAALKPYTEKLTAAEKANGDLSAALSRETIGNRLAQSKYAEDRLTPAGRDLILALNGDKLKVEDGAVYGVDANGAKILSRSRHGEVADLDELLGIFTDAYPHKDHILKSSGAAGSGAQGGNGGGATTKTITRSQFDAMPQAERMAASKAGVTVTE